MLIPSFEGSELELHLAGHRWPLLEGGQQVLHWLRVPIRALTPYGSVSFTDQCLLDWEAEQIIDWLAAIARSETVSPSIDFYEGTLAFDLVGSENDVVTLRCHLLSLIRYWTLAEGIDRNEMDGLHQQFYLMLTRNQLAHSAHELHEEFERLPVHSHK